MNSASGNMPALCPMYQSALPDWGELSTGIPIGNAPFVIVCHESIRCGVAIVYFPKAPAPLSVRANRQLATLLDGTLIYEQAAVRFPADKLVGLPGHIIHQGAMAPG